MCALSEDSDDDWPHSLLRLAVHAAVVVTKRDVIAQEVEDAAEVEELHGRVSKLLEQVESGRDAVLASHRAVLDYADSAIARVSFSSQHQDTLSLPIAFRNSGIRNCGFLWRFCIHAMQVSLKLYDTFFAFDSAMVIPWIFTSNGNSFMVKNLGLQLGTLRVECEKRECNGGDESWLALGEGALASLQTVRAYRERTLQAAYSGVLPPSPRQLEGAARFFLAHSSAFNICLALSRYSAHTPLMLAETELQDLTLDVAI